MQCTHVVFAHEILWNPFFCPGLRHKDICLLKFIEITFERDVLGDEPCKFIRIKRSSSRRMLLSKLYSHKRFQLALSKPVRTFAISFLSTFTVGA